MSDTVLSIVIPAFSVERYLDVCLSSVLDEQMLPRDAIEVILVDDGSTDGTLRIARERARRDARLTVVAQENLGPSAARNAGAARAGGRYLAFVDADDIVPPHGHRALLDSLERTGSDLAVGAYVRLVDDVPGLVQPWVSGLHAHPQPRATLEERPDVLANVISPSKMYRLSFWRENGFTFPEGLLYEDQELSARIYASARAFDILSDVVYHWRLRSDRSSISQQERALPSLRSVIAAMRTAVDTLERLGHPAAAQARLGQILDNDLPRLLVIALGSEELYRSVFAEAVRAFSARTTSGWDAVRAVQRTRLALASAESWTALEEHERELVEKPAQSIG